MEKPKEILELEKHLGFELTETKNPDDIFYWETNKTYQLNDEQSVIVLNLFGCKLKNISFLQSLSHLTTLNLSKNEILDYSFLQSLPNLVSLDLGSNKISDSSFLRDLTGLTNLHLGGNKILDYSFLQNLPNLTSLDLRFNKISDISFLRSLTDLTNLSLSGNKILDYSFLQSLPNLTNLNLSSNKISEISFLHNLSNLTNLNVSNNNILDYSFLQSLPNLTNLNLGKNEILDYSFLQSLPNLTNLNLEHNKISDISFLQGLPNLTNLNLEHNKISDISFLQGLPNLTNLNLEHNQISDISFLQGLPNLTNLDLRGNQISDIYFLQNLPNLTNLDLRGNQISDIYFLQNLPHLTNLDLKGNQISNISALQNLPHLTNLDLSFNQIADISSLQGLPNLTNLDLEHNQIADISFLQSFPNLTNLDLRGNQISNISFLRNLPNLTNLNLERNQISDISALQNLINLTNLNLENNQISDISPLESLTNLVSLNLSGDFHTKGKISDISALQNLTNLTSLSLSNNQITTICLSGFSKLINLNVSGNPLQVISLLNFDSIEKLQLSHLQLQYIYLQDLANLTNLDLSNNYIYDISFLQDLTNLRELNLAKNRVYDISFLRNLTDLSNLSLASNQISDISVLQNLTNLSNLNVGRNEIIDYSVLQNLIKLQSLNLENYNGISDISFLKGLFCLTNLNLGGNVIWDYSILQSLVNLKDLVLDYSKISDISFLKGLINLQSLDLRSNNISSIELAFLNHFPNLEILKLLGNPIKNIPREIFGRGSSYSIYDCLEPVRNYLEDLEKGKTANKEIKLIFIGNGSVGKTQVAKRLCEQENFIFATEHQSTHAIALLRRELAGFELNCWDFAGQDIYHATHRLFMQTRALLVLVWDFENETQDFHIWQNKQYENEKLRYWLEYAKCFAPESPILVLQNKVDAHIEDLYFEYKDQLKADYPIIDFLPASAKTGEGFKVLERAMKKVFQENDTFKTPPLPTNWVAVRQEIRHLQTQLSHKTLTNEEFAAICQAHDCKKSTTTILDYLHDTGVFYYRQGYFNNQIILNQDWAIQAIYKILNRESEHFEVLRHEKGKLDYELLCEIWADHTDQERELFIDFMLSAELAFETINLSDTSKVSDKWKLENRTFVISSCLSLEKPQDVKYWEQKNATHLQPIEISYSFLPKVFIQRLIVKAHRFSEVRLMWQKGLLLKTTQGEALVEACYEKGQQKIMIAVLPNLSNSLQDAANYLANKIKEELAEIANKGKFRGREGREENPTEKFGLTGLNPIFDEINVNMTTDHLRNLANTAKFAELFEILDTYFDKHSDYQYSTLKQNILHQLNNNNSPTPAQLQGLLVFLNGKVVKENLGSFKEAIAMQKNNSITTNGNGNINVQGVDSNSNVTINVNNGTNSNANSNNNLTKNPAMPKKVFISYNHGDKDAARHLKNALVKEGIEVTIDSEAMAAGSKISDFIRKSIQETDITVSIVSEKSLLSAWVAMESILTLHNQKQFIACYITDKFFDLAFVRSSAETVALRIDNIQKEIQERFTINMGIEDLSDELSRQQDLRHNLPKIIGELRSRLCIDIAGYNFLDNVPKVIKAIKGE